MIMSTIRHHPRWPFLALILLILALVVSACAPRQPQIKLETTSFSFDDVVNGVIVSKDLLVKNTGSEPLVVDSVSTTCGCTSATLEPMTIAPGASGTLHIEFDSGAHGPELTGTVTRQVFLTSNDPDLPDAKVEFTANVLPRPESAS